MTNHDFNEILALVGRFLKDYKKSKIMSVTEERGYDEAVEALKELLLDENEEEKE